MTGPKVRGPRLRRTFNNDSARRKFLPTKKVQFTGPKGLDGPRLEVQFTELEDNEIRVQVVAYKPFKKTGTPGMVLKTVDPMKAEQAYQHHILSAEAEGWMRVH